MKNTFKKLTLAIALTIGSTAVFAGIVGDTFTNEKHGLQITKKADWVYNNEHADNLVVSIMKPNKALFAIYTVETGQNSNIKELLPVFVDAANNSLGTIKSKISPRYLETEMEGEKIYIQVDKIVVESKTITGEKVDTTLITQYMLYRHKGNTYLFQSILENMTEVSQSWKDIEDISKTIKFTK